MTIDILNQATSFARQKITSKIPINPLGLKNKLGQTGRFPPIELVINPLGLGKRISLNRFTEYDFNSSILVPVDTFSFKFVAPDDSRSIYSILRPGDMASLFGNQIPLATGIIDQVEIEVTEAGEMINITGRDLMSQLEDNMTVDIANRAIYGNNFSVAGGIAKICETTRIQGTGIILQDAPLGSYLLATEPGETKLAALQRFIEPLNIVVWMSPTGQIVAGRPNFNQRPRGRLVLNKSQRKSNVMSMRATRATTRIPNVITPIFTGQEEVVPNLKEQSIDNKFPEPSRLKNSGHVVNKIVTVSNPQGASPQDLSGVNALRTAGGNILQSYAKRELARANVNDLIVQVVVAGHYNELGEPYSVDTMYTIDFDRAGISKDMYLYEVEYRGGESEGQRTVLTFTQRDTIVSDSKAF